MSNSNAKYVTKMKGMSYVNRKQLPSHCYVMLRYMLCVTPVLPSNDLVSANYRQEMTSYRLFYSGTGT